MTLLLTLLLFAVGVVLLVKGAEWLVDGASSLARRIGMSELAIGLTIVAFGTSMPELTVNVTGALAGSTDIAIGNVVGSNIANILLILGITAILSPIVIQTSTAWKEIPFALLASIVLLVLASDALFDPASSSVLGYADGLALLCFFLIFLWYTFGMRTEANEEEGTPRSLPLSLGLVALGLLALVGGGKLTVDSATTIARFLGASEALIGLTIVAVGTSLPELMTSVIAGLKKKSDIAVGNIVGSNIFNIFFILGVTGLIRPLPFAQALNFDLFFTIFATLLLFFVIHNGNIVRRVVLFWRQRSGHVITRLDGSLMLLSYAGYIAYIVLRG